MKSLFFILSIVVLIYSVTSFIAAINEKDAVKRLLHSNLGCSQLIIATLVLPKLSKDIEDL